MAEFHLTRRCALAAGISVLSGPACASPQKVRLGQIAARHALTFGAAIEPQFVKEDQDFAKLIAEQCRVLTAENALKWNALRPSPDQFDFAAADRVAAIAQANGVPIHGHCLVWHEAMPDWLIRALSPATAADLMTTHIDQVVRRYAGRIVSWDVVNEVIERNDRRLDGLRQSPWLRALGPDYIDLAFHAAHAADPQARLSLADYGLEYDNIGWMVEKRGTLLERLRALVGRGVPIHALALQGHLLGDHAPAFGQGLADFLAAVADLGLDIYVTELDVNDQNLAGSGTRRDSVVADIYARFLDVVLAQPAVKMVVTWGLSDRYTSKTNFFPRADGAPVRPLPFDQDLKPKAAAKAIAQAFDRRGG